MVNKVILIGNVGADPEIRTFEDGSKVARVNLATTERIFNSKTQERNDRTEWHRLTIWRGLATVVEQYVRKGSQLYIEGRIRNTEWTDANGQKRYGVEINVDVLNLLGRRDGSSAPQPYPQQQVSQDIAQPQYNQQPQYNNQPQYNQQPQYNNQPQYNQQPQGVYQSQSTSVPAFNDAPSEDIDDLPF